MIEFIHLTSGDGVVRAIPDDEIQRDFPAGPSPEVSLMTTWLKSLGAVVAGFLTAAVVVLLLTWLSALVLFGGEMTARPTPGYLAFNLSYSFVAAVLGGWVSARLAPRAPVWHAVAVTAVMVFLASGGGDGSTAMGVPGWYGTAIQFFIPVGAVFGGLLHARSGTRGNPAGPGVSG
ncbi:MAG: hypothetical protein JSU98_09080 [Gemmatimonadales bacterium]|nr:MAG: hypothetical protein JSU98_09080 [Gemmatimonadales bacterium]